MARSRSPLVVVMSGAFRSAWAYRRVSQCMELQGQHIAFRLVGRAEKTRSNSEANVGWSAMDDTVAGGWPPSRRFTVLVVFELMPLLNAHVLPSIVDVQISKQREMESERPTKRGAAILAQSRG